jgi:hypothetical protein
MLTAKKWHVIASSPQAMKIALDSRLVTRYLFSKNACELLRAGASFPGIWDGPVSANQLGSGSLVVCSPVGSGELVGVGSSDIPGTLVGIGTSVGVGSSVGLGSLVGLGSFVGLGSSVGSSVSVGAGSSVGVDEGSGVAVGSTVGS